MPINTSTPSAVVDTVMQPDADSSSLTLVVATPIEHVQTTHLNAEEWRGCLTAEQYFAREDILHKTDLTRKGGITCWILTSKSLPRNADGSRPIFASCETILFHAYVARDGHLDRIQAHGIGTVYTPAEHRGKGYAGRMMTDLGPMLETWQQIPRVNNVFSVLFSDIGPTYYTRFGWKVYPSDHVYLSPLDQDSYKAAKVNLPTVRDLTTMDLAGIPAIGHLQDELRSKSTADPGTTYCAILPSVEHLAWHHAREEFVCQSLVKQVPKVKGAIHESTGLALIWSRVFAETPADWQLHILHTVIPHEIQDHGEAERAMSALLLRAQFEAYSWGMLGGVEIWDPPSLVVSSATHLGQGRCDVVERHMESLCSLRWAGNCQDQPVWISKQKYTWC